MHLNKLGLGAAVCSALFSLLLCVFLSSAAYAQAQTTQFTKTADGPNFLYAKELSDNTVLQVDFSLLGYTYKGDATYEDPGDWDIGPHFNPTIASSTYGNTSAIGRIFWLEPGSSITDPNAQIRRF